MNQGQLGASFNFVIIIKATVDIPMIRQAEVMSSELLIGNFSFTVISLEGIWHVNYLFRVITLIFFRD